MKNFASIYSGGNDSSALNQSIFLKLETTRGTLVYPTGTDFLYVLAGGKLDFSQPFESSPHRSARHHNNIIKQKTTTEWSFSTLFNIKQSGAYGASIDTAIKMLWKSMLGTETDTTTALEYDPSSDPSITFSMFENLDHMAKQASGLFVESCEISLPGDGMAQANWAGSGMTVVNAGIGKSVTANAVHTVTLVDPDEARRFDVGSKVMVVKADGVTRSADTAIPRTVESRDILTGNVVLSGAVLADSDGSVALTPVYLCYWEPVAATIVGIDEPQTGLQGSISIDTLPSLSCLRSATVSLTNNHEKADYCYGTAGLSGPLFIPGGRLDVKVTLEMNLNANLVEFMSRIREFEAHNISLVLGDATNNHFKVELPRVIFPVPSISVPDSGSIPISFSDGFSLQQSLGSADEITISYL
jgi:hypothetical protein